MSNFTKLMAQAAAGAAGGGDFYPYTVDYSCRFYGNDKLTWTAPSGGNRKTFTISLWAKPALDGTGSVFFNVDGSGAGDTFGVYHQDTGRLYAFGYSAAISYYQRQQLDQFYRDPSAWYHWVFAYDTTATTTADRFKTYVNGVELDQSNWTNITTFPLNADTGWNESGRPHEIGEYADDVSSTDTHMYMAQFAVVDGQQLDASSFGEFKNGIWVPKDLSSLTWGNNGFWLDFADSSNLGNDVSGNNNDFTSSGLTSSDQMTDTPTNNFATWNPLKLRDTASAYWPLESYSEGNLAATFPSTVAGGHSYSTIGVPDDTKMYAEIYVNSAPVAVSIGVDSGVYGNNGDSTDRYIYSSNTGSIRKGGTTVTTGSTYTAGDIIGICVDRISDEVAFYKNGTLQGTITGAADKTFFLLVIADNSVAVTLNAGQNGTFNGNVTAGGNTDANGLGDFKYTVPTDALAICTANLPEPTIGPNSDTLSDENFNTVLWTGNGTTKSITGVGFQPDFTWIKNRTDATTHNVFDAVRGVYKNLKTDTTDAEGYNTNTLSSFDADGFTVGLANAVNGSGDNLVAWNWKANGSGVSNTDGTVTSTVSVNQDAGFSIITYPYGKGTAGHGLGAIPDFLIIKERSPNANSWYVWHKGLSGTDYFLNLNNTGAESNTLGDIFYLTSTTFSSDLGLTGRTGVAYAFLEVEGFSSFGSYTGNGSADGPFVYTGFRPAFVITKRTDTSGYNWVVMDAGRDQYNVADAWLYANSSSAEVSNSSTTIDFLSNGFKFRGESSTQNASGGTWIYIAFAENPFKYANAR
jgi:hypothetical protein